MDADSAAVEGSGSGRLSVADVLVLDPVKVGSPEVLAGADHLGRSVRCAHTGEVRNLPSLLRGDELVLTTGIALSGDKDFARFTVELAERGAAGLIFELGEAYSRVPPVVVDAAAAAQLPLIVLHREVAFVDVVEAVNHAVLDSELTQSRQLEELNARLTELVLDGADVPQLLGALAAELRNPIVMQRDDGELLYHAVHLADSGEVLAAWDGVRRGLADAPAALTVALPRGRESQPGSLTILAVDQPLAEIARFALTRAGMLIAVLSRQLRHEEFLAARERGNVLAELMDGELSEAEIARRVTAMGFARGVPYLLPCLLAAPTPAASRTAIWTAAWREIRQTLEANAIAVMGGLLPGDDRCPLVLGLPAKTHREARADLLADVARRAFSRQLASPDHVAVFVGDTSRSWTAAIRSLRDVTRAAEAPRTYAEGWHDATRPDLGRLLWGLRQYEEVQTFVERRLAPVIEHDAAKGSELLRTLEAFLDAGGNKTEAARALHLERQSLYHRISRLESLLGDALEDPETRLGAHLAVYLRPLISRGGNGEGPGRG